MENRKIARIFVDMDGTLNMWGNSEALDPAYFENRPTQQSVVDAVKLLIPMMEVYILTSVFKNEKFRQAKNNWLDREIPEVDAVHRIFVDYGESKGEAAKAALNKKGQIWDVSDVLLDDNNANLFDWYGVGIKCHSDSTNVKGGWKGYQIHVHQRPEAIADTILGISYVKVLKNKEDWVQRDELTGYRDRMGGYIDTWYAKNREDNGEAYNRGVEKAIGTPGCPKNARMQ